MEDHRLQVMPENYSKSAFNKLFKETLPLRKKLSSEIDPSILGLSRDQVLSEFDMKLLFAFQKYHNKYKYEVMKGHVIRALQMYKYRLIKISHNKKFEVVKNTDSIDDHRGLSTPQEDREKQEKLDMVMAYMRKHLSADAYLVFCTDIEPPIYIKTKLEELNKKPHSKVPAGLIAEYFGWGDDIKKVSRLRSEVKRETLLAIEHFNNA